MELTLNTKINNFTLYRSVPIKELDAQCLSFRHEPTGLELVWLKRNEENKVFGIAFETLPFDDSGVFHILEHSVLCGSEKYPVKEPFVELMKGSLNTFLNAMTFSDKTFYPISTRNNKDYENLMRVYLDAVFHPSIYTKPEIFMQEGWHYEFDENGKPSYKGVVLNEMRGAFSSDEEIMETTLTRALFPDSPYRYVSGGEPTSIPTLTYEKFIETHQKYYSPSNAYIYLDGDVDLENTLRVIDEDYLSDFTQTERIPVPQMQCPVDGGTVSTVYEIAPDEDENKKNKMVFGRVIGRYDEIEKIIAAEVLGDVLFGSNQAPVCKAVLFEKLAEDVSCDVRDGVLQPWIEITVSNYKKEDEERISLLITSELERLSKEGIDKKLLEASLSNLEFKVKENNFGSLPQGIAYGIEVLYSVLYGGNPELNLEVEDLFVKLRKKAEEGYFEGLIKDVILNNNHKCTVLMIPSKTEGERRQKEEQDKLDKLSASWSEDKKHELLNAQERLLKWQHSTDSKESLDSIPCLTLKDAASMPEKLPLEEKNINGIKTLIHKIPSNGIVYTSLYFDIRDFTKDEISAASMLAGVIGDVKTANYSEEALIAKTDLVCGNVSYGVKPMAIENSDRFKLYFTVKFSALEEKLEEAVSIISEILSSSDYSDKAVLADLLRQEYTDAMNNIIVSGHSAAVGRVKAQLSDVGVADEYANGLDAYYWIKNVINTENFADTAETFKLLTEKIFCKKRMVVGITSNNNALPEKIINILSNNIKEGQDRGPDSGIKALGIRNEAIIIPSDVSYASEGCRYNKYIGGFALGGKIVSLEYLWTNIRVKGGAYGGGMLHRSPDMAIFYSYRDPSGVKSYDVYEKSGEYLKEFCKNIREYDGYIIGCIGDASPVLTPIMKGDRADEFYLEEFDYEQHCGIRKQLLNASYEDLEEFAEFLNKGMTDPAKCLVGSKKHVDESNADVVYNL